MLQHKTQDEFALFIDIPIVDKSSKNSSDSTQPFSKKKKKQFNFQFF